LQWCVAAAEADKEEIKIARMQQYSTHTTQKKEKQLQEKNSARICMCRDAGGKKRQDCNIVLPTPMKKKKKE